MSEMKQPRATWISLDAYYAEPHMGYHLTLSDTISAYERAGRTGYVYDTLMEEWARVCSRGRAA